jgi:hypothetical protein
MGDSIPIVDVLVCHSRLSGIFLQAERDSGQARVTELKTVNNFRDLLARTAHKIDDNN